MDDVMDGAARASSANREEVVQSEDGSSEVDMESMEVVDSTSEPGQAILAQLRDDPVVLREVKAGLADLARGTVDEVLDG
jgi:hypothetical protein